MASHASPSWASASNLTPGTPTGHQWPTTFLLTTLALVAFAANSVLCRMALGRDLIDPASFTSIRVVAGALTLVLLALSRRSAAPTSVDVRMVIGLFLYMVCFSFAYVTLSTGTGALILFGVVQITMFGVALTAGESFSRRSWAGLILAAGGLIWQVAPGVTAPDALGALLMTAAGIGWAMYTLRGRHSTKPLVTTATNFVCVAPLVMVVSFVFRHDVAVSSSGITLAVMSGALASGAGYALWYTALTHLRATQAATVQLCVPALAALAGIIVLDEPVTMRLLIASCLTLGGIAIVLADRRTAAR